MFKVVSLLDRYKLERSKLPDLNLENKLCHLRTCNALVLKLQLFGYSTCKNQKGLNVGYVPFLVFDSPLHFKLQKNKGLVIPK